MRMRWAGHMACLGGGGEECIIIVVRRECWKRPCKSPGSEKITAKLIINYLNMIMNSRFH
jgi:hypothetical protein